MWNKRLAIVVAAFILLAGTNAGWALGRVFKLALPGYKYSFPRDHFSHNDYKTEWWYYTGHLRAADGTEYGYELTFFRVGMNLDNPPPPSAWSLDNVYMAHFAICDLRRQHFFHAQRLSRSGVGFAGASEDQLKVFVNDWSAKGTPEHQNLTAQYREFGKQGLNAGKYAISLHLTPAKPVVEEGENGVSQKAACRGCASHYYSFTRLNTKGEIVVDGRRLAASGISWMDHEFGSNQLTADQAGWDWFSIQLDDNMELMLYIMRRKDGSIDAHSSGTIVMPDGRGTHLSHAEFTVKAASRWHSAASGATYPIDWSIAVPLRHVVLHIRPDLLNQELTKKHPHDVTYWEGSSSVDGTIDGRAVHGKAYVEMTGYAAPFSTNI